MRLFPGSAVVSQNDYPLKSYICKIYLQSIKLVILIDAA